MLKRSDFEFRHFRDEADIAAMLAVHDACRVRDQTDPHSVCYSTPNLTPREYEKQVRRYPAEESTLIVESAGVIVAHGLMNAWGTDERLYLWKVWVKPQWRGLGVGTDMLRWGEANARTLHGQDLRPALHLANATENEADSIKLLESEGYGLNFVSPELEFDDFESLAPIPDVAGVEFRMLEPGAEVAVARALSEANLNPPDHELRFTGDELQRRLDLEHDEWMNRVRMADPLISPVAWAADQVIGAYLCQAKGVVGEISQVAVKAGWRGRGIARSLCVRSLHELRQAGCVTARLFTSKDPDELEPTTGTYAMYRKFGFKPVARHLRYRKPMLLQTDQVADCR